MRTVRSGFPAVMVRSVLVRWTHVWKAGEEIVVGPYPVLRDLPVGENGDKHVHHVIGKRATIARIRRRVRGLISEDVWQQTLRDSYCVFRRVPSRMLQRVRERRDEPSVIRCHF